MESPIITTVVENSEVKKALEDNGFNVRIIGDFESVYSTEVIINSDLETIAKNVHSGGKGDSITTYEKQDFYKEYNYRSTLAQVIYHLAWWDSKAQSDKWDEFKEELEDNLNGKNEETENIFNIVDDLCGDGKKTDICEGSDKGSKKAKITDTETAETAFTNGNNGKEGSDANDNVESLYSSFDEAIDRFSECFSDEKDRWNYYEYTEGFEKYPGPLPDKRLKDDLHRHNLIMPFSKLSRENGKDESTGKTELSEMQGEAKYFVEAYRNLIKKAGKIKNKNAN